MLPPRPPPPPSPPLAPPLPPPPPPLLPLPTPAPVVCATAPAPAPAADVGTAAFASEVCPVVSSRSNMEQSSLSYASAGSSTPAGNRFRPPPPPPMISTSRGRNKRKSRLISVPRFTLILVPKLIYLYIYNITPSELRTVVSPTGVACYRPEREHLPVVPCSTVTRRVVARPQGPRVTEMPVW